jgi:hypothetical protein
MAELQVGRGTDRAVAERVLGWTFTKDPLTIGRAIEGRREPVMFHDAGGDLCVANREAPSRLALSTDDGQALRYVWPKIVARCEEAGDINVAFLYDVEHRTWWADREVPHRGEVVVAADCPTLAEAICRFALALYPEPGEETS